MKRILINTLKNIRRSPYQSLAAIMILVITSFITQAFFVISYSSTKIINYFETQPQVTAFFTDEASESAILATSAQFSAKPYVANVDYVSKQDALEIYRNENKDDPLLLEMVTADILPASLEISTREIKDLSLVKTELEQIENIEEVVFQQDVVDALKRWSNGITLAGLISIGFLTATSALILITLTTIKISSKKKEIAIQRLLGASSGYIISPFIFEAAFYGFVSALIAWAIIYLVILYTTPVIIGFLDEIPLLPLDPIIMLELLAFGTGIGFFIGAISAFTSTRRYFN